MLTFTDLYEKTRKIVSKRKWPSTQLGVIRTDWQRLMTRDCRFDLMMTYDGIDPRRKEALSELREHIINESQMSGISVGELIANVNEMAKEANKPRFSPFSFNISRAAAIKVLFHLYFVRQRGEQGVWVYSPPASHISWAYKALNKNRALLVDKLDARDEYFTEEHRKIIAKASEMALNWVSVAQSRGYALKNMQIMDWFCGLDDAANPDVKRMYHQKVDAGFREIRNMLNKNTLIFSYHPQLGTHNAKEILGFVYPYEWLDVIYIKNTYDTRYGASPEWNCAITILHEVSHRALNTLDYSYDWQGLKPGNRGLRAYQAIKNAESWAYFIADMAFQVNDTIKAEVLQLKYK
jgi:hypothetical protein